MLPRKADQDHHFEEKDNNDQANWKRPRDGTIFFFKKDKFILEAMTQNSNI